PKPPEWFNLEPFLRPGKITPHPPLAARTPSRGAVGSRPRSHCPPCGARLRNRGGGLCAPPPPGSRPSPQELEPRRLPLDARAHQPADQQVRRGQQAQHGGKDERA